MGEDLSSGARVALTLITLCAVVAIVFSILRIMKNAANTGANSLSGGLNQMMLSQFDDYDQQVVDGNKAIMAVKTFEGQQVAICVSTIASGSLDTSTGKEKTGGTVYNYNCVLEGASPLTEDSDKNKVRTITDGGSDLKLNDNQTGYIATLKLSGGTSEWNMNTKPTEVASTKAYIRSTGKFRSYIIKNKTDDIIGVYFKQIS